MLWNASTIAGYAIASSDGQAGTVNDLIFEDSDWTIRWLGVGTGGWLSAGRVLVPVSVLGAPDPDTSVVPIRLTMTQIEQSPEIGADEPVTRELEARIIQYYHKTAGINPIGAPPPNAGLHRLSAMIGDTVEAADGGIGHAEDFLVDTLAWEVRFIAVDTANWWPGEKVLISPRSVEWIDVARGVLQLDTDRQKVKDSPPYTLAATADGAFEEQFQTYTN